MFYILQYELTILDDIVLNKLNPTCSNLHSSGESLDHCVVIARISKREIENNFLSAPFRLKKGKLIHHYFYSHQGRLIFLCDFLFGNIYNIDKGLDYSKEDHKTLIGCMHSVYNILEKLLGFIYSNFNKYFNLNLVIPEKTRRIEKRFIRKFLTTIESSKLHGIKIWDITFNTINDFLDEKSQPFTYNNVEYIKELVVMLIKIIGSYEKGYSEEVLRKKLISYNFNTWHFLEFLVDDIRKSVQGLESVKLQLDKYYWHMKQVNQITSFSGKALVCDRKSIMDLLCCWIAEEIYYLEKSCELHYDAGKPGNSPSLARITTNLSVSQLAYFTRLLVETEIIKTSNQQELFRTIAGVVKSKRAETISEVSIGNKYYIVEPATRQHIKSLIIKILNEINKN